MTVKRIFGSAPNQIARNKDLGSLAWQNKTGLNLQNTGTTSIVGGSPALPNASQINFVDAGASNGYLTFSTTASGTVTERMRIDSAGNLGLGVTPSAWTEFKVLQIGGAAFGGLSPQGAGVFSNTYYDGSYKYQTSAVPATYYFTGSGSHRWYTAPSGTAGNPISFTQAMTLDASGYLAVGTTSVTGLGKGINIGSSAGTTRGILLKRADTNADTAFWYSDDTHMYLGSNNGFVAFYSANTERMRIDSSGNVLVGTTSAASNSGIGVKAVPSGAIYLVNNGSSDGIDYYNTTAGAYRFYVSGAGQIYATSTTISAISDKRFKENIVDLDDGLNAVMALKPRKFDWKEGKGKDIKNDRGFIAQEFEQVFPDLIDEWKDPAPEGEDPYKSVRQDLIPVLVKAIQELKAELDELKAKVN